MRLMIFRAEQQRQRNRALGIALITGLMIGSAAVSGCRNSTANAGGNVDKGIHKSFDTARKSDGTLPPEAQKAMDAYLAKQNGGAVGAPVNAAQKK